MSISSPQQAPPLVASPGDVLFSESGLPTPDLILQGFRRSDRREGRPEFVSFHHLQRLLEFLEFVVLTERLVVPVAEFGRATSRLVRSRSLGVHFQTFRGTGDFKLTTEDIAARLAAAGILFDAHIRVGERTCDDLVERRLPFSRILQARFAHYRNSPYVEGEEAQDEFAKAQLSVRIGAPLHVAEAASITQTPYVLGFNDIECVREYEVERLRQRTTLGQFLLDRVNASARKELAQLTELGLAASFPETPIASMILHDSTHPEQMIDVALEIRTQFTSFRRELNAIEHELASADNPVKVRLKRVRQLEKLAASLWPTARTGFTTNAVGLAETALAIPEISASPIPLAGRKLIEVLKSAPIDRLINAFRRRRIRLFVKARKRFLTGRDTTERIARILSVPAELVRKSRVMPENRPV